MQGDTALETSHRHHGGFDCVVPAITAVLVDRATDQDLLARTNLLRSVAELGWRAEPFRMFKFRTMVLDAESQREKLQVTERARWSGIQNRQRPSNHKTGPLVASAKHR